jgi:hypothetical protein
VDTTHALSPFDRPLDLHLQGLRAHSRDAYRLIPGKGDQPDRWICRCPLHPDVGLTLVLVDQGADHDPALWCVGCPPAVVRYVLIPDPEREREAERRAAVLLWAQSARRAA